ncbi:pimeloyl-ACP methyl ester carboxylesterase/effector-binding domain-containing protein [Amycolatopsis lexingtonensis]|uniref:Pimeloyl-ACP methyl ester carboxylesterase/effector-binding domain-containing protein n=1 Tax=Amycolatopsis lexingtonensis TaxID=218822 RepID=A0ABR9HTG3_9PSEU|nr:alpha/beta fold hydrolase [Amycolatopsis lexingtonensis]MBE1494062.1 pimeloyl-ACP methyl ester carboxylesterase/effector-binding domain-containing protein [Amycolatopsis lexingtonensis]
MTSHDQPQPVSFVVAGVRCAADLYWPPGDARPVPCVVMAHGGSGTKRLGLPDYANRFAARGMAVLVFDYRHFGDSDGSPRQVIDVREQREDYRAAVAHARTLPGIDPDRIALWGTSLSGGHVLAVAADDPAIAAVVAQVPVIDGWRRGRTLAQRLHRDVVELTLRFTVAAGRDLIRWWRGEPPYLVPVVDEPGRVAVFVESRAGEVFSALGGEATGWRNAIAPRFVFALPRYRRGTAERLAMPLLMCLADHDLEASSRFAARIAAKAPLAEVRHYPAGHFDVYLPPWFDRLCADQAEFLHDRLGADDHTGSAPPSASRMMTLRTGTGEPLVFLPGLESHEHAPRGLGRWFETRQCTPLAEGREVWWVARRGDGTSPTTIADLAREHAEALRWWFGRPVDVVGVSTGGSIALQLAADHPDVVRRLVVVSAAHRLGTFGRDTQRRAVKALRQRRPHRAGAAMTAIMGATPAARRIMRALGWLLGPAIARPTDPGLAATIDAEDDFDLKVRLPDIAAPTLVVGGDQDACYGRELFEETAAGIPGAGLILYPGRGHLSVYRGQIARDIRAFLDTEAAAAPADTNARTTLRTIPGPEDGLVQEYPIHDRTQAEQRTAVTEATLTVPEIGPWLGKAYTAVAETLGRQGIAPAGPPFARYGRLDGGRFHVEAGFPVDAVITSAEEVHPAVLPGGTVAATVHIGPYDAMEPAYAALIAWIKARGGEPAGAPWETYLSDPAGQPDPATWRTDISQPYRSAGTAT